ncbi:MAG: hypothetical protein NZ920_03055 [Aigarchaeota archaeon]|nr:hypothetical protein [Aigarchaeota archaeon]MDW8092398.1 hypothetical protein [Nitrososphaerota archaeon]
MSTDDEEARKLADLKTFIERKIAQIEEELTFLRSLNAFLDEQLTSMSFKRADVLIRKGVAAKVEPEEEVRAEAAKPVARVIRSRSGASLGTVTLTKNEVRFVVNPDIELRKDDKPFSSFLVRKVLESMVRADQELVERGEMREENSMKYEVVYENEKVREITVRNYRDERRLREIMNSVRWTLETATSK